MRSLWLFVAKQKNRQILGWLGAGIVVVAGGAWTVGTYFWPAHEPTKTVCAQQGVVVGGNISGSTLSNNVTGSSGSGPCVETDQHK